MSRFFSFLLILNIFTASAAFAGYGPGRNNSDNDDDTSITEAEIAGVLYMREEEKLARDIYLSLYQAWGNTVFENIAASEQSHTDAILVLLNNYDLEDPAYDDIGVFFNVDLQALYTSLLSRGMQSETEALMVGALIEEVDMLDIQHAIDAAQQEDIISTYESLLCGSRNHLRAFVASIEESGVVYQAQVLTQDVVDDIVDSPVERNCSR